MLLAAPMAFAQLANIKVVTDATPDYHDMESMVRSITGKWETDEQKMWALFYWDHKARRQTNPQSLHGMDLTDPIRQYNDYGFTMCSTISGIKCSTWNFMGYPSKYYDIGLHTVPEVWFNGRWNHYDNSLSVMYTLCDGRTIAGIEDVGKTLACETSGGKSEPGHVAIYHALNGTGPDGFLEGADTIRDLRHVGRDCFAPNVLKYRWYLYDQDRGHRYILNIRDGESYTRFYSRQDKSSPNAVVQDKDQPDFKADPAYFVGNPRQDPETANPRYRIRGNGHRVFTPVLTPAGLPGATYSAKNITVQEAGGLKAANPPEPAEAIFKVEGSNVITSLTITASIERGGADAASIAISSNNGRDWKDVWTSPAAGDNTIDVKLLEEVNGRYEILVKVAFGGGAVLKNISFDTITQLNTKTQPQLKLGKNTIYVGAYDPAGSIVVWPELQAGRYRKYSVDEKNIAHVDEHIAYQGAIHQKEPGQEAHITFKVDAPTDILGITYGGRLYNRHAGGHIDFYHSFDAGKTWHKTYTLADTKAPWDVIHYETVGKIPPGTRSVLFKYTMNSPGNAPSACSIYAVRMEVNHTLPAPGKTPLEVTFNWGERQKDYSLVERSHTQLVAPESFPFTYEIHVGGHDHPVVNSLRVSAAGAGGPVKPGYSDGREIRGNKFIGRWATYGKNLAQGKPYTTSIPSLKNWDSGDPDGKKLTDGVVGSSYSGGLTYRSGALWDSKTEPEIVVDLGSPRKAAAFRIHIHGYEPKDAIKGEVKDRVEVLTSNDGVKFESQGAFDFNLYWKDIPVNYMFTDEETFGGHNHILIPPAPVEARYVKYKIKPDRFLNISEVQVLESVKYEPFDLRISLPDAAENGRPPVKSAISPAAKKWEESKLPKDVGKPRQ